jgi:PmbA protein
MFDYDQAQLRESAEVMLRRARTIGATGAAVDISENSGFSVNLRRGRVETIEQHRDKGIGVTVYIGHRRGHASSSDYSRQSLEETVDAAFSIARFTAEDTCAGLPDPDTLAVNPPDLDLFHPWTIDVEQAVEIARAAEAAAFATSPLIRNSEGASVTVGYGQFVSANSLGFFGGYPYSRHSIACAPIARRGRAMQRDDWYSSHCKPSRLADPERLGRYAAERALSRLGAKRLSTRRAPVLFESPLACGLLGHFVQAASGGALYRKTSFLTDSLGSAVFAPHLGVVEDPHQRGESGSAPFDGEGCTTFRRRVVDAGVLQGYFLSTYSARKLGMKTTGNAGGSHHLRFTSTRRRKTDDLPAMLRKLNTGLFITDLMGQGVNYVTGDYSRGATGFWVEGGVIQYPVEEITIAGNLRDMFRSIVAVGADEITRGSKRSGSILIESMAIAGI